MKILISIIFFGLLIISSNLTGQDIHGLIVDSESELPLGLVNIGVVDIPYGTITNELGVYSLNYEKLPKDCKIKFSMIGYESQIFNLNDLKGDERTIKLVRKTIELDEVIIKKVGTIKTSKAGVCGWVELTLVKVMNLDY